MLGGIWTAHLPPQWRCSRPAMSCLCPRPPVGPGGLWLSEAGVCKCLKTGEAGTREGREREEREERGGGEGGDGDY